MERNGILDSLPNAISQDDSSIWLPMHDAAAKGDTKKIETFLDGNLDRTIKEPKFGNTPLHECANRGYSRCVKLLCTRFNIKNDKKDKSKKVSSSDAKSVLQSAILSIRNNEGNSPLHLASQNGHNQSCRELLLAGTDADLQNNYGDTALHTACRYGHAGATRILLSASCNVNKTNLNGDTALHISCAMGRRKLTRILLEANCNKYLKNSQMDTPYDIAFRKNYTEILDILNNPQKSRRKRDKPAKQSSDALNSINAVSWSPYGCHYFPDPRAFPSPKLESLPKEPLRKGEQYYLDLAGCIHKGPIGVANTCYCGPFFRHIEHKINCNHRNLRKFVHKAKESLDHKVEALAVKTHDQIEQLTRSVIEERARCKSRRMQHEAQAGKIHVKSTATSRGNTLTRSQSLEILDNGHQFTVHLPNSHSCGSLDEVTGNNEEEPPSIVSLPSSLDLDQEEAASSKLSQENFSLNEDENFKDLSTDFYDVSNRLGDLLYKTNFLLEMEETNQPKGDALQEAEEEISTTPNLEDLATNVNSISLNFKSNGPIVEDTHEALQNSHSHNDEVSEEKIYEYQEYLSNMRKNDFMVQNVIRALSKERQVDTEYAASSKPQTLNDNKLSYKASSALYNSHRELTPDINITTQNSPMASCSSSMQPSPRHVYAASPTTNNLPDMLDGSSYMAPESTVKSAIEKFEIKNSEIKTLKKAHISHKSPYRSITKDFVARLRGKLADTYKISSLRESPKTREIYDSESSEDEKERNLKSDKLEKRKPISVHELSRVEHTFAPEPQESGEFYRNPMQNGEVYGPPSSVHNLMYGYHSNNGHPVEQNAHIPLTDRVIPKDAYFHELPRKKVPNLAQNDARIPHQMPTSYGPSPVPSAFYAQVQHNSNPAQRSHPDLMYAFPPHTNGNATSLQLHMDQNLQLPSIERDASNDSGISTRICGGSSQLSSPTHVRSTGYSPDIMHSSNHHLKYLGYSNGNNHNGVGHNYLLSRRSQIGSPREGFDANEDSYIVDCNMGKVSSLV